MHYAEIQYAHQANEQATEPTGKDFLKRFKSYTRAATIITQKNAVILYCGGTE